MQGEGKRARLNEDRERESEGAMGKLVAPPLRMGFLNRTFLSPDIFQNNLLDSRLEKEREREKERGRA